MFFLISLIIISFFSCSGNSTDAKQRNETRQNIEIDDEDMYQKAASATDADEEIYKDVVFRKAMTGKYGETVHVMFANGKYYCVSFYSSRRIYLEPGDTIFYKIKANNLIEIVRICWKKDDV